MTDYKLTKDDCKLLTEFLGECWHEFHPYCENGEHTSYCIKCLCEDTQENDTRNFSTPNDQHAVFKKLVESVKFSKFYLGSNLLKDGNCEVDNKKCKIVTYVREDK